MRTRGSKNIKRFGERTSVPTSTTVDVKHLAALGGNPLKQFVGILNHQANFLSWIETRHEKIVTLKKKLLTLEKKQSGKGPIGGKEGTFVKYRWYSDHLVLLEAINAFETFYKNTLTQLGAILQPYVHPDKDRVVKINARLLWGISGEAVLSTLVPALVFEHELFHDLDEVDWGTDLLIGKRRYNKKTEKNPLAARVKALRGIFQVRHTLTHNCGMVTKSDYAKFKELNLGISQGEVIDPVKESLSLGILKELELEANEFTKWLRSETAKFLEGCIANRGLQVPKSKKEALENLLGSDASWNSVNWS